MDANLRREIILDNYENPMNRGLLNNDKYIKLNTNSDSCIDNIDLEILIENDIIKDIRFDGEACTISTAATSIMINTFVNKKTSEVLEIIKNYENMIDEKEYNSDILEELNVYEDIYKQANRKKCALLPVEGLKKVIENYKNRR